MVLGEAIIAFLKLQQRLLSNEDNQKLVTNLLPDILTHLTSIGLKYNFISAVFIQAEGHLETFIAETSTASKVGSVNDILNVNSLFDKNKTWEQELLWGKIVVLPEVNALILSSYKGINELKSVALAPIKFGQKMVGILVLGHIKLANEISQEEINLMEILANLVGLAFRLQSTQSSLTNITQEVYKMNLKLHDLDKLKDDFVSIASHELRTPMTAIRSYVWMALNRSDINLSEKMKKYLSRTLISTERLINLVNDMLNVSRIEAGSIEIKPQAFDMIALADEVMAEVGPKAAEKNLHLVVNKVKLPLIFADQDKVHQVLLNLIGNSLKFTPTDGTIVVKFFTDGKFIDTSIQDTGVGISKEDLSSLFKKFARLDNSYVASATSGGTGLGLYIAKSLVCLMGGNIGVCSEGVGRGSTFTFSLPIATSENIARAEKYSQKVVGVVKQLEPVAI